MGETVGTLPQPCADPVVGNVAPRSFETDDLSGKTVGTLDHFGADLVGENVAPQLSGRDDFLEAFGDPAAENVAQRKNPYLSNQWRVRISCQS